MAAPKNNQFWKLRSKHGRDKIFQSPEILMEAALEYFEITSKRQWIKKDFKGKDAVEVDIPTSPPFTIHGLLIFLDIDDNTWYRYKGREEFRDVVTRIEKIIYVQKFEGATVGAYSPNIIARDLGLVDKKEQKLDHTTKGKALDFSQFSKAEKIKLLEALTNREE